jgi:adenosylcobinamide-phosphate synthase
VRALAAFAIGEGPATWENWGARVVAVITHAVLLSTLFAGRALVAAGQRMRAALDVSLDEGRNALSHLCSRDPSALSETELCGATVESLTENTSDSFVAPLFWCAVACTCGAPGLAGAAVYRAVNTLDAMVGYRGKYEYLGKCAARLDDVLNWVPARLTAVLLLVAAAVCRYDVGRAWQTLGSDRNLTESPNAGWPMSVAAGALGVELTKRNAYVLGRGLSAPTTASVRACERLIVVTFALCTFFVCAYAYACSGAPTSEVAWRWA